MNRPFKPLPAALSPESGTTAPAPSVPICGVGATLLTADASTVSPRRFLDAIGLGSPEMREARRQQTREQCIRAIKRGDTYGFPPVLVEECRAIIDDQETGWNRIEL